MSEFKFNNGLRKLALMVIFAIVIWSLVTVETCDARKGKHLNHHHHHHQNRVQNSASSLYKKKIKSSTHHHHHRHKSSKPKPHPTPPPPLSRPPPPEINPGEDTPPPPPPYPPVGPPPPPPPLPAPPAGPSPKPPEKGKSGMASFDVMDFGAKGDGRTDDSKAFEAAWASACKVEASTLIVPSGYQFLVGPISFSGPYCQPNIVFQVDGTIKAPTDPKAWGNGLLQWLEFSKLRGITIQGNGIVDGSGAVWWQEYSPYDDPADDDLRLIIPLNSTAQERPPEPIRTKLINKMPKIKPTAVRFYGSFNVTVTGIMIQNSPQCHLKFDNCVGVFVHDMTVSSPGDSANTDGIHLQNSRDVLIHSTSLACGDDCISIQTGCSNVYIHNVNCGPGHGISIGSLGRYNTKACVSNITVRDVNMHNTMTGVRIKTWQGGLGSVQGVLFSNIQVSEVQLPIVIDQFYCDKTQCKNQSSAVAVSGITYERIRGTYTVKPVHFACSDNMPCTDVTLNAIQLKPQQEAYHMYDPFCWQAFGELRTPTVPPIGCLQLGKPASNAVQSDRDTC